MKIYTSLVSGGILFLFVLGLLFPEPMWGIHSLGLMPTPVMLCGICIAVFAILRFAFFSHGDQKDPTTAMGKWVLLPISILVGILVATFPICLDSFGDANAISSQMNYVMAEWDSRILTEIFKLNFFDPKIGETTFYGLVTLISYLFNTEAKTAVFRLETLAAILFTFFWGQLVWKNLYSAKWRLAVLLMGLSGSFMLIFQAHLEVYALPITFMMGYLVVAETQFRSPAKWKIILLFILFPFGLKLHFLFWLFAPILIFGLMLMRTEPIRLMGHDPLSLKTMLTVFIPLGIFAASTVYFITIGGIKGTRDFNTHDLYISIFLPITAIEGPPFDRYGLLSWAHFLDLFNLILFWSPVAFMLILIGIKLPFPKWNSPFITVMIASLFAFLSVLFILNPLLGLPMDSDLFSLPVPLFLVLALMIANKLESTHEVEKLPLVIGALSLLSATSFVVVSQPQMLSQHYQLLGQHTFKTYWKGASTEFENALKLESDLVKHEERRLTILAELLPYSVKGADMEYSELLRATGRFYADSTNNLNKAIGFYEQAYEMDPMLRKTVYDLVITNFRLGQPDKALMFLEELVAMQYPNKRKASRIAIHVSLAAHEFDMAFHFCTDHLLNFPEDKTIIQTRTFLKNGEYDQALSMFKQS